MADAKGEQPNNASTAYPSHVSNAGGHTKPNMNNGAEEVSQMPPDSDLIDGTTTNVFSPPSNGGAATRRGGRGRGRYRGYRGQGSFHETADSMSQPSFLLLTPEQQQIRSDVREGMRIFNDEKQREADQAWARRRNIPLVGFLVKRGEGDTTIKGIGDSDYVAATSKPSGDDTDCANDEEIQGLRAEPAEKDETIARLE